MSVCEAGRRLVLGALVLFSLCQQLRCQEAPSDGPGLTLTLKDGGGTSTVTLGVEPSRNITLVPGLTYNINCNGEAGFGGSTMVWFRDGVVVPDRTGQTVDGSISSVHAVRENGNNWILVLQRFMDVGSYTCRGMNGEITLVIGTSNPTAIAATPLRLIPQGPQSQGRPTLTAFISGSPAPTAGDVTWFFNNGSPLPDGPFIDGSEIVFPSTILPEHSGNYTIRVNTSSGTATAVFQVIVTSQPIPDVTPDDRQIQRNSTAITLTCEDSAGVPSPEIRWERNGVQVQNENGRVTIAEGVRRSMMNITTSYSTLTINSLLPGDNGTYECVSRNTRGSSTDSVVVEVLFKPILRAFSSQLNWVVGSTALLQVLLVSANPVGDITVEWLDPSRNTIDSSQYTVDTDTNGSTVYEVTLPSLGENDGGVYTCVVANSIGSTSLMFAILVSLRPVLQHTDGSTGVRTVLSTDIAAQVSLRAKILGARPPVLPAQVSWRKGDTV